MEKRKYQLFKRLSNEQYKALENDILKRGVLVAVEYDEDGEILDGHHRVEIATKHDIQFEFVTRKFKTEQEKKTHVRMLNIARRHLTPLQWGTEFRKILEERGVKRGSGGDHTSGKAKCHSGTLLKEIAEELGVPLDTAKKRLAQADTYESLPEAEREKIDNDEKTIAQAKREQNEKKREAKRKADRKKAAAVAKVDDSEIGKFSTIVVDPPWDWSDEGDQDQLGRAKPDYATMTIDQIEAVDIASLALPDCHLYLWITNRSLPKGFRLIDAWGFRYVTCITWCKPSIGMGNYFRGSTEHLLFGIKGSMPLKLKSVGTWFAANRGRGGHSSKPSEAYDMIETCSPGPYVDVFSRRKRKNWNTWGVQE